MKSIDGLLNTIKQRHNISSDYKLALYLGLGAGNIANYRHKRSMPDAKACAKIATALEIDPHVLMVHFEAQRAKDGETRALWENLAMKLQAGHSNVSLLAAVAIISIAASARPVWATVELGLKPVQAVNIMLSRLIHRIGAVLQKV